MFLSPTTASLQLPGSPALSPRLGQMSPGFGSAVMMQLQQQLMLAVTGMLSSLFQNGFSGTGVDAVPQMPGFGAVSGGVNGLADFLGAFGQRLRIAQGAGSHGVGGLDLGRGTRHDPNTTRGPTPHSASAASRMAGEWSPEMSAALRSCEPAPR